jgi:hypothetical protein
VDGSSCTYTLWLVDVYNKYYSALKYIIWQWKRWGMNCTLKTTHCQ